MKIVEPEDWNPPSPPEGLSEKSQGRWWDYWNSDVAWQVRPDTDMPAVERYFEILDEIDEAREVLEDEGLTVEGSTGQEVEHPMIRHIDRLRRLAIQLEDRLGMSVKARRLLGIAAQKRETLKERTRKQERERKRQAKAEDPRIALES